MRRARVFAVALSGALAAACGSKSALPELGAGSPSGGGGAPSGGASFGGAPAGGASFGGAPAGGAGGSGGGVETACVLSLKADPEELLSFPEGDADTPLMVVLESGAATGQAKLAYAAISQDANFWHPELRIAELTVTDVGAKLTKDPVLYGFDSHAWGEMVHAPGASSNVALAFFHADEASPNVKPAFKFRSFDPTTWSPGPEVPIDPSGSVVYGFVPGATVNGASYSGLGYAVSYRGGLEDGSAEPRVAVLDEGGKPVLGPVVVSAPTQYPGRASDVAWTGSTYLVATSVAACAPAEATCKPNRVVVASLAPSGQLSAGAEIAPLEPGAVPFRSSIASSGAATWLAWSEALPEPKDAPRTVRMLRLSDTGAPLGSPIVLATGATLAQAVTVAVTDIGVVVWWGETADATLPESTPGHSRLVLHHYTGQGAQLGGPLAIPTTAFAYGLPGSFAVLDPSLGALASWAATSESAGKAVTWLARLRCSANPD